MFDLNDHVALVIGGRGYLGRDFCAGLEKQGAWVHSADLPQASLASKGAQPIAESPRIFQHEIDVTDPQSVHSVVEAVIAKHGRIDILVFSASSKPKDFYAPYTECSLEGWQSVIKTELDGMFLVTQQVGRHMEKARKGSIILMGSIYGVVGNDQRIYEGANLDQVYSGVHLGQKQLYSHASYVAAKGAHIAMVKYLAAYWGSYGIRVNCVSPGGVSQQHENETFVKKYCDRVPLARKAERGDITSAIIYLASNEASYITGHNLIVDGGWTAW